MQSVLFLTNRRRNSFNFPKLHLALSKNIEFGEVFFLTSKPNPPVSSFSFLKCHQLPPEKFDRFFYRNLNKPGKVKVSVVDGVVHPKRLDGVSPRLGKRRDHLTAKYTAKRMKHISPKGKAALFQQSMKRAKAAGDNSLISG